jgi:hypothetical protein
MGQAISFKLPINALGNWTGAKLSLNGNFSTNKEKMSSFSKDCEIDSINEPRGV